MWEALPGEVKSQQYKATASEILGWGQWIPGKGIWTLFCRPCRDTDVLWEHDQNSGLILEDEKLNAQN